MTRFAFVAATAALFALPAAADITINDAYARVASPMAQSGAAFMGIQNSGAEDDRLVAARSDVAQQVELHTHIADGDVMRMVEVEEGFEIPAGTTHMLERGGHHVMFMGLNRKLAHGDEVAVTLVFENAGEMDVIIPVDLERNDVTGEMGGMKIEHDHSHDEGDMKMEHDHDHDH